MGRHHDGSGGEDTSLTHARGRPVTGTVTPLVDLDSHIRVTHFSPPWARRGHDIGAPTTRGDFPRSNASAAHRCDDQVRQTDDSPAWGARARGV